MKVDRHTKTKKSVFCSLEIFRVREKDFPVEVVELKGEKAFIYVLRYRFLSSGCRRSDGLLLGAEGREVCDHIQ